MTIGTTRPLTAGAADRGLTSTAKQAENAQSFGERPGPSTLMRRDTGGAGAFDAFKAVIEKYDVCILCIQLFQNVLIAGNMWLTKANLIREEAMVEALMQAELGAKSLAIQDVGIAQACQRVMLAKSGE